MAKPHRYPPREAAFLHTCCEFVSPTCDPTCFCRQAGCIGVWSLRADVDFDTFLKCYADLWVRGCSDGLREYIRDRDRSPGGRWTYLAPLFRELRDRWDDWAGQGRSLPSVVSSIRRCYFCDDAFERIHPIVRQIEAFGCDQRGIYTAKLISQLFYDIAVPFDTGGRARQKAFGYVPEKRGGGLMRDHVRQWVRQHQMPVSEFRHLDNAPRAYWSHRYDEERMIGTACSRVLDKLFYGHGS